MAYATKKKLSDNSIVPLGSNLYGTCSTASATAQKVVSMQDFNVLVEGVTIHVYFSNKNTASNPTLKVGSTDAKPIRYNGQADGSWEDGGFISFTYYSDAWHQNDITIGGVTYTFSISGHTMTISGSDGSTQTVTLPDDNTTYTLTKSGSTIKLTGSDGSETSVTDDNTAYSGMTQAQGEAGTSTTNMVISPKVLHDVIEALDDDTTYGISISGHTITLTPSSGTAQSVTIPDNNTTYSISKSGNTVTLTGSDGSTSTFTDANTTYSAGTGLSLSGTTFNHSNSVTAVTSASFVKVKYDAQGHITGTTAVTKGDITALGIPGSDTNTTYTLSISGHTLTLTPSSGNAQSVTLPDNNTTYSAGSGLKLSSTTMSLQFSVGDVITTSTNTNPSSKYGGTWTLIHKRFESQVITTGFTWNDITAQNGAFFAILNGNTVELRFIFQNKVAISENTAIYGALDHNEIGISSEHTIYFSGQSDGLNAMGMFSMDFGSPGAGGVELICYDWVTRATSYPSTTGQFIDISCIFNARPENMLDDFCDEFVWKRTA